jgi:hypothetical protein
MRWSVLVKCDPEPIIETLEPRTEQRTENREPRTENREPRTENREPRTETENQAPGSETENQAPGTNEEVFGYMPGWGSCQACERKSKLYAQKRKRGGGEGE